jgi:8-oxo-dGTP pyrophosphatase MutT (NUDIX family)
MTDYSALPPCFFRVSIKALVFNSNNEFLLLLENDGRWSLPGGGLERGESNYDCLQRELLEEGNLKLIQMDVSPITFISTPNEAGYYNANVIYKAQIDLAGFVPMDECVEYNWFRPEKAMQLKAFPIVHELASWLISQRDFI